MTSRKRTGQARKSGQINRLDVVEEKMGRVASLLSEVAEALAEYPDGLKLAGTEPLQRSGKTRADAIRVHAREWPSFEDIETLLAAWYAAHEARAPAAAVRKVRRHTPI